MITLRPVVLAGTDGLRVHPLSTAECPQKFLSFLSADSSFQDTLERVSDPEFLLPLIVTTPALKGLVQDQCDDIAYEYEEILLLDEGAGEAAAASLAAEWAMARKENYPLLVIPSDHFVADQGAFMRAVTDACLTAEKGYMVSFGVVADRLSNQHSYLQVGARLDTRYSGHHVPSLYQRPSLEVVEQTLQNGPYVWNAGLLCACPDPLLSELERQHGTAANLGKLSLEDAVLVNSEKRCVVSLLTTWADLTTWPGIWKALTLIET